MRIGRDDEAGSQMQRGLDGHLVEIESFRLCVYLEQHALLHRRTGDRVEVECNRIAAAEQASRGMAENVDGGMPQSAEHPSCLSGAGEGEAGMD